MSSSCGEGFAPGTLWPQLLRTRERALQCGALQPIDTTCEHVEDGGVRFLVRVLANLRHKQEARARQTADAEAGRPRNPFLPPDPDLLVAEASASHRCVLNKFPVVDHHLLIVTREFEAQEAPLTGADFAALARCLWEIDGLAFYNSAPMAGASQPHKHLQLVPLPLDAGDPCAARLPIEPLMAAARFGATTGIVPALPFRHALTPLDPAADVAALAATLLATYQQLQASTGEQPYNLLATRRWMLWVARGQEGWEGISVNALGFAGTLLVRDHDQLARLRAAGPMTLLRQVSLPVAGPGKDSMDSSLDPRRRS